MYFSFVGNKIDGAIGGCVSTHSGYRANSMEGCVSDHSSYPLNIPTRFGKYVGLHALQNLFFASALFSAQYGIKKLYAELKANGLAKKVTSFPLNKI